MRKRRRWILVLVAILVVGLSYATYSLFIHSGEDYLTVSELKLRAESLYSQPVRVEGRIVPGSINWDDKAKEIRFAITDDKESLIMVYEGFVPENFKPGAELIVEGRYRTDGVLEATSFGSRRSMCNLCH